MAIKADQEQPITALARAVSAERQDKSLLTSCDAAVRPREPSSAQARHSPASSGCYGVPCSSGSASGLQRRIL